MVLYIYCKFILYVEYFVFIQYIVHKVYNF